MERITLSWFFIIILPQYFDLLFVFLSDGERPAPTQRQGRNIDGTSYYTAFYTLFYENFVIIMINDPEFLWQVFNDF